MTSGWGEREQSKISSNFSTPPLRLYRLYMWLNLVKASIQTFYGVLGGRAVFLLQSLKTELVCKFLCLNLLPTNPEWPASFFGLFLLSVYRGQFWIPPSHISYAFFRERSFYSHLRVNIFGLSFKICHNKKRGISILPRWRTRKYQVYYRGFELIRRKWLFLILVVLEWLFSHNLLWDFERTERRKPKLYIVLSESSHYVASLQRSCTIHQCYNFRSFNQCM